MQNEALDIDPVKKTLRLTDRSLRYDFLVIATGSALRMDEFPGIERMGHILYTREGALHLHRRLHDFEGGHIAVVAAAEPYCCPTAVVEAALLADEMLHKRLPASSYRISIYIPDKEFGYWAGPPLTRAVESLLRKKGIELHTAQRLKSIDPGRGKVQFAQGDIEPDLLMFVPRHVPRELPRRAGLGDRDGWITVDQTTFATRHPDVYAIGDAVYFRLPTGRRLFLCGGNAHGQAWVLAANLAGLIQGKDPGRRYEAKTVVAAHTSSRYGITSPMALGQDPPWIVAIPPSFLGLWVKLAAEWRWLKEHR